MAIEVIDYEENINKIELANRKKCFTLGGHYGCIGWLQFQYSVSKTIGGFRDEQPSGGEGSSSFGENELLE